MNIGIKEQFKKHIHRELTDASVKIFEKVGQNMEHQQNKLKNHHGQNPTSTD